MLVMLLGICAHAAAIPDLSNSLSVESRDNSNLDPTTSIKYERTLKSGWHNFIHWLTGNKRAETGYPSAFYGASMARESEEEDSSSTQVERSPKETLWIHEAKDNGGRRKRQELGPIAHVAPGTFIPKKPNSHKRTESPPPSGFRL